MVIMYLKYINFGITSYIPCFSACIETLTISECLNFRLQEALFCANMTLASISASLAGNKKHSILLKENKNIYRE